MPTHNERDGRIERLTLGALLLCLLLLLLAPAGWDLWRAGLIALPFNTLLIAIVLATGLLVNSVGRRAAWLPRRSWVVWAGAVLAAPLLVWVLDTTGARVLQAMAAGMLLLGVGIRVRRTGETGTLVATALLAVVLFGITGSIAGDGRWIGPCHLFGDLHRAGCVRSLPLEGAPLHLTADPVSGETLLVHPYQHALWLGPVSRPGALFNQRAVQVSDFIDRMTVDPAAGQATTFTTEWIAGTTLMVTTGKTVVDVAEGTIVETVRATPSAEEVEAYVAARNERSWPRHAVASAAPVQAVAYADGTVAVWQTPPAGTADNATDPFTILNPLPRDITAPAGVPSWSLQTDLTLSWLALSPQGRWLAVYGDGTLTLYDVTQQQRETTVPLVATSPGVFSGTGGLLAVADERGAQELSLVAVPAGEIIATLPLPGNRVQGVSFAPDDRYVAVSADDVGAIFDLGQLESW